MDECLKERMYLAEMFKNNQKIFIALGDETRQLIFLTLLENEVIGMRVPDITKKVHLSRPAVSHHLRILKESGLVNMHRKGTKNYYYVDANETAFYQLKKCVDHTCQIIQKACLYGYPNMEEE